MGKQVKKHGYSCKLVRVVDGDTCDAMIDLGTYRVGFNKIKSVANQLLLQKI